MNENVQTFILTVNHIKESHLIISLSIEGGEMKIKWFGIKKRRQGRKKTRMRNGGGKGGLGRGGGEGSGGGGSEEGSDGV